MPEWQRPCVEKTTRQIIHWLSAYSTSSSILHGNYKARKLQRDWMSPSWSKVTRDSFPQWYLHKLGALQLGSEDLEENVTAFRNGFHSSAVNTQGQNISQTKRVVWWEWWRNYRLHKTHQDYTSTVSNTTDYNNISMTRAELWMCWIPGWARKQKELSLLQIQMAWKCSMMH